MAGAAALPCSLDPSCGTPVLPPACLPACLAHLQLIKISTAAIQSQLLQLPPPELIPNVTIILLLRKLVLSFSLVESAGRPRYCLNASMPSLGREVLEEERKIESLCGPRFFRRFRKCKLPPIVKMNDWDVTWPRQAIRCLQVVI